MIVRHVLYGIHTVLTFPQTYVHWSLSWQNFCHCIYLKLLLITIPDKYTRNLRQETEISLQSYCTLMSISMYTKIFRVKSMAFYIIIKNKTTISVGISTRSIDILLIYSIKLSIQNVHFVITAFSKWYIVRSYYTWIRRADRAVESSCYIKRKTQLMFSEKPIFLLTM